MKHQSIQELFSRTAERFGDSLAARCGERSMTYRELEEGSNRLANLLLGAGVPRGSTVAIMAEASLDIIVSLIGILKAGCAFVPLDPSIPDARLAAMVAEVSPAWFVVEPKLLGQLERAGLNEFPAAGLLCLGGEDVPAPYAGRARRLDDGGSSAGAARPPDLSGPDDLCYVYFTSGSTGRPKGIAGRLKGIAHFIEWEIRTLGIGAGVRVSQLMSPSFDGVLRDVFVPLCAGGTVCVPPGKETILDARKLVEWLDAEGVNLIHCIPSLFRSIVNEELTPAHFPRLRHILMAGEPLLPADVRRWTGVFGERVQLVNLYGTSETTMAKFYYFVKPSDGDRQSIPVGVPMEGAKALVVDGNGRPCRPGKVGEIYIRTPFRSLGYYRRPELTAEAFIPNPFSDDPHDIVYKTGDLGRLLPDGNFEYLGRRDSQVKIRGVRVELTEVEDVLRSHGSVKDVAVVDRDDEGGEKYLCAYVVLDGEVGFGTLREFMLGSLPEVMVPAAFVAMHALPRTFSGKVDRRALPAPDRERRAVQTSFVAPRTQSEEVVAGIWTQVLGVKRIGVNDNFFDLGGHSLRMTQVVSRLSKAFQVELPLRALFEIPTVSGLAQRIETIRQAGEGPQVAQPQPAPRDGRLPLSFAQQRLWFVDQLDPGGSVYNLPVAARLKGHLDVAVLEQSMNEVVRRQESLRTSFDVEDGQPVQVITPSLSVTFPVVDLRGLPAASREAEALRLAQADALRPFDLRRAPLLRVTLLALGEGDWVLLLNQHHIISDTWSSGVLLQEMSALYESLSARRPSPLPEVRLQYADYAHWQRQWLQGEALEAQLSYWRGQLAGAPAALQLPTDRPRPPVLNSRGGRETFTLPESLSNELVDLSRREGVSLFMLLLAAFQVLLSRYSGQQDVCVGTPIAGRNRLEFENLIGFFVNTLVLRTDLSGNPRFRQLLGRVREVCLGAYAHQDVPLEKLVEELQPERNLNRTPLFQVMLILQNAPLPSAELPGVTWSQLETEERHVAFDMALCLVPTPQGMKGLLDYNTDLFDAATVRRLLGHFQRLLEAVAADPEERIEQLPLLTEPERRQLLVGWNETAGEYDADTTVHELFERQAARTPAALAVVSHTERLTYSELSRRSTRLARYLRRLGIAPGRRVGLLVERSAEMLVGLLGVLKAGAAYVPLDPQFPRERLDYMLADAGVAVLLTQEGLDGAVSAGEGLRVVHLDGGWEDAEPEDAEPEDGRERSAEEVSGGGEGLAYVIYTSGSTGRPKGVMIPHRAVVNTLLWRRQTFSLSAADRILQNIPFTFDPSVWQIFGALVSGATLVLLPPDRHRDAAFVAAFMAEHGITITDFPPTMLQVILRERGLEACRSLRCLFCGGEALPAELPQLFFAQTGAELFNQYGPTETAIDATFFKCEREGVYAAIPIGRPIANKRIYLLDAHLQPVPVGVIGQLHVGGAGLAYGYVGNPAATAESFIPDPFGENGGERLYRTGDLARYLPDGQIEFVGRADQQVKIRGNRVEPGEVETALGLHPAVRECAVVALRSATGEQRLVAYVAAADEERAPGVGELRAALKQRLPEYMVPSAFVLTQSLPRTPGGKVDRPALAALDPARPATTEDHLPPRSPVEEVLCGIWAEVLGVERVGVHDNFFELGGHSLLATQVISRVREAFPVEIPLRRMFESVTVAQLAAHVEERLRAGFGLKPAPPAPVSREGELPPSFAQQRLWFLERLYPGTGAYNMPLSARLDGRLDVPALRRALGEVVRRHEVLRTAFDEREGQPAQAIMKSLRLDVPVVDLSGLGVAEREDAARKLAAAEARRPFDLSRPPLLRAALLRLDAEQHVVLLTLHHVVSDGWSMGILMREVATLYGAFAGGEPSPLPALPIQYADFAHWQWQQLGGEALAANLAYWGRQLGGTLPVLELPTDRPRPQLQTFAGSHEVLPLPEELAAGLRALSRRQGVTLFMTLLASFAALLSRYARQEDVLVGTPVANRNHLALEDLIGLFVNTLVLRTDLSGDPRFTELLKRVREMALGAYAHQELPFEKLVGELRPDRDLSRSPMFQVMFNLQTAHGEGLELPGLRLGSLTPGSETAQFDLTLTVVESQNSLTCSLGYNTDLFDAATVRRLLGHFQRLLEAVAADPARRLSDLPCIGERERRRLLTEFNATAAPYPQDACLHDLFDEQAARTPSALAVVGPGEELTYLELSRRAARLSRHLRRLGVGAEQRVGVLAERSAQMLVALLGVLKAGAAYVPLDAAYPRERLAYMVEDAGVRVLLTHGAEAEAAWLGEGVRVVRLDGGWESEEEEEDERDGGAAGGSGSAEGLAYVIYTSGSTGRPKGVMIPHRAVVNFLYSMRRRPGLSAGDRLLAVTTLSFDIAVLELFLPLVVGATVIMLSREVAADGVRLREHLEENSVTAMQATPATWRLLLEAGWTGDRGMTILCGGEALDWELARRLVKRSASAWNMYGPTETTIWSAARRLAEDDRRVLLGGPVANTQLYVLDRREQLLPCGAVGELYIGGEGLARGYRRAPALTAERFVPDPFSGAAGARLYKTGDLARYMPDGSIEYLGRVDQQLKLRGYRIEPGEVEAALKRHAGVREAVVVAREATHGGKHLVAYVVARGAAPGPGELRALLKERLPDYMVPASFVMLENLPLTPNGKVDRRALPAPDGARSDGRDSYVAPGDQLELQLAQLWEEVLGVHPVGVHDNFFDLGGHSFLGLRLMARVSQRFGQDLPLASLFQSGTVREQADLLRRQTEAPAHSPLVAIQPAGTKRPFFCVHEVTGSALNYVSLARCLGGDQPFYAFQRQELNGGHKSYASLAEMAADYVEAMRAVQPDGPYRLGGWSYGGLVAFEMAQQLEREGREVGLLALFDTSVPAADGAQAEEDDAALLAGLARAHNLSISADELRRLGPDEQLDSLLGRAGLSGKLPGEVGPSHLRRLLEVGRSNHRAAADYVPQVYPRRITLLRSQEILPEDVGDERFRIYDDPALGWGKLSAEPVEVHVIPGNHFTLLTEPHVYTLAERLRACLDAT
jgi:amino acid adenylation domain-containing protein